MHPKKIEIIRSILQKHTDEFLYLGEKIKKVNSEYLRSALVTLNNQILKSLNELYSSEIEISSNKVNLCVKNCNYLFDMIKRIILLSNKNMTSKSESDLSQMVRQTFAIVNRRGLIEISFDSDDFFLNFKGSVLEIITKMFNKKEIKKKPINN